MRIRLPLWIHQLVEYVLAVVIVTQSVNAGRAASFLAVTGGLLFVLAATTDASMGAFRWIPPRLHRGLDVAVIAALVAAPIVAGSTEPLAWALCLLAAAAIAWLNWHTRWRTPGRSVATPDSVRPEATPPVAAEPTTTASLGASARDLGKMVDRTTRGASRAAGRIYGRARSQRPRRGGEEPRPKT